MKMLGFIHHICHYCTGGRQLACPAAVEHGISQYISMDKNTVVHIIYTVQRIIFTNKEGGNHCIIGIL